MEKDERKAKVGNLDEQTVIWRMTPHDGLMMMKGGHANRRRPLSRDRGLSIQGPGTLMFAVSC
eukprot:362754-Chlamydomonas_euryale.AAC.3